MAANPAAATLMMLSTAAIGRQMAGLNVMKESS
jgi:hypothetical protein